MKTKFSPVSHEASNFQLSTADFAAQHLVEPQTVRKQYCVTGSYHGVRPLRLPNRKLLWPANSIDSLLASNRVGGA